VVFDGLDRRRRAAGRELEGGGGHEGRLPEARTECHPPNDAETTKATGGRRRGLETA
jgi:hypothetical protein